MSITNPVLVRNVELEDDGFIARKLVKERYLHALNEGLSHVLICNFLAPVGGKV